MPQTAYHSKHKISWTTKTRENSPLITLEAHYEGPASIRRDKVAKVDYSSGSKMPRYIGLLILFSALTVIPFICLLPYMYIRKGEADEEALQTLFRQADQEIDRRIAETKLTNVATTHMQQATGAVTIKPDGSISIQGGNPEQIATLARSMQHILNPSQKSPATAKADEQTPLMNGIHN